MINKIGTNNSLSGYPLLKWWHFLLRWFYDCQTLDLMEQYSYGVRYFDLCFKNYNGVWYGSHKKMLFKVTLDSAISLLRGLASKQDPILFRIVCESNCSSPELLASVNALIQDVDPEILKLTCIVKPIKIK